MAGLAYRLTHARSQRSASRRMQLRRGRHARTPCSSNGPRHWHCTHAAAFRLALEQRLELRAPHLAPVTLKFLQHGTFRMMTAPRGMERSPSLQSRRFTRSSAAGQRPIGRGEVRSGAGPIRFGRGNSRLIASQTASRSAPILWSSKTRQVIAFWAGIIFSLLCGRGADARATMSAAVTVAASI